MAGELDRSTAERALRRALELAGGEARGLTPEQLVAIGTELGVAEADVRRAIAEVVEQRPDRRPLVPTRVAAARVVASGVADVTVLVARWFESDGLRVRRRPSTGVVTWEPVRGGITSARQGLERLAGSDKHLRHAPDISSVVEPLSEGLSVVRLTASLERESIVLASVIGLGGIVVSLVAAVVWWWPAALGVLAGGAAGVSLLGVHRRDADRLHTALERRLDQIERGETPANPLAGVKGFIGGLRPRRRRGTRSE